MRLFPMTFLPHPELLLRSTCNLLTQIRDQLRVQNQCQKRRQPKHQPHQKPIRHNHNSEKEIDNVMKKIMIGLSALFLTLLTGNTASAYGHANAWGGGRSLIPETRPRAPMPTAAAPHTPLDRGRRLPTPMVDRHLTRRVQVPPLPATATVALRLTPRGRALRLPTAMAGWYFTRKVQERPLQPMLMVKAPRTMRVTVPSVRLLTMAIIHPLQLLSTDRVATTVALTGGRLPEPPSGGQ